MFELVLGLHAALCFLLVVLVLLQEGKDIGQAFGAGGANTLFGSAGIDKPIVRATTTVAVLFMVTSIILVNLYSKLGTASATKGPTLPDALQKLAVPAQTAPEKAPSENAAPAPVAPVAAPQAENNAAPKP